MSPLSLVGSPVHLSWVRLPLSALANSLVPRLTTPRLGLGLCKSAVAQGPVAGEPPRALRAGRAELGHIGAVEAEGADAAVLGGV